MSQHRIYSEEEATEVLKRAALLHERAQSGASIYAPGITRAELQKMAEDMGISPDYLRMAMEEASIRAPETSRKWEFTKHYDHVFSGELHPDRFDVVSSSISIGMQSNNTTGIRQIGRTVGGSVMAGPNFFNIEVTSRGGRTRLKAMTYPILGYIFGAQAVLLGSALSAASYSETGNMPLTVAGVVASIMAGAGLLSAFHAWGRKAADKLIERVTKAIEEELDDQASTASDNQ